VFPEGRRNYRKQMRTFLSKGVIPAVATWILGQVANHLGETHPRGCTCHGCGDGAYELSIKPNEIVDFRINRKDWKKADLSKLRHWEDLDEEGNEVDNG